MSYEEWRALASALGPRRFRERVDCRGAAVSVGDTVRSTPGRDDRAVTLTVTGVEHENLILVRDGDHEWRSAAFLWERVAGPETTETTKEHP